MDTISVAQDKDGNIYVTRPNMRGIFATHKLACTEYSIKEIADWLEVRMHRGRNPMVQDAFPKMSPDDREFLMTGITPGEWLAMFPNEKEEIK
jgi:hypothetical protein